MPSKAPASTETSPLSSPFLFVAQQAATHARSVIWLAGNQAGDLALTAGGSAVCVVSSRLMSPQDKGTPRIDQIHRWAARASASHCGNCAEYAAVAFVYLEKQASVRPLDFMRFSNGDHMYVVIGRAAGSDVADPSTWGRLAVVCDPWKADNTAYPASDLRHVWPGKIPDCFYPLA